MNRLLVLFDGNNFYNRVKRLNSSIDLINFNYRGFVEGIAGCSVDMSYYIGEIRRDAANPKSHILYSRQQVLFKNLRTHRIKVKLGYLSFSGGSYHEKGVDVLMAVDMVYNAVKDYYDNYYLISSDTDLVPAIKATQSEGKHVTYVGFEGSISQVVLSACSSHLILGSRDLYNFSRSHN